MAWFIFPLLRSMADHYSNHSRKRRVIHEDGIKPWQRLVACSSSSHALGLHPIIVGIPNVFCELWRKVVVSKLLIHADEVTGPPIPKWANVIWPPWPNPPIDSLQLHAWRLFDHNSQSSTEMPALYCLVLRRLYSQSSPSSSDPLHVSETVTNVLSGRLPHRLDSCFFFFSSKSW